MTGNNDHSSAIDCLNDMIDHFDELGCHDVYKDALQEAVDVLQEAQKRDAGCRICLPILGNAYIESVRVISKFPIENEGKSGCITWQDNPREIYYCPMCGRKLYPAQSQRA